jgi:hypothetical protein
MGSAKAFVFLESTVIILGLEFEDLYKSMSNNTKASLFYASRGLGWARNRTHALQACLEAKGDQIK